MEPGIPGGHARGAGDEESGAAEAFGRSRACFEELITTLAGPQGGRLAHAQMEEQLTALSRELVRTLHQDSLDLRTVRAENLVRGPDLQSCLLTRPALMITSHVPAVRFSPDHAGGLLAAAVSA